MTDWLPIVVGGCIIALALAITRLAPNSTWAQELRRPYGIRPTGARGHRTRRDHVRSAGIAAISTVLLVATTLATGMLTDRLPDGTRGNTIGMTYTLVAFMFATLAAVIVLRSSWKAVLWRVELPDTPAHRRALADALDHLVDDALSAEERAEYLDVRYLHPQIEQVRRATLKLVAQHRSGVPDHFRTQIKQWTAGIRGSAGA